MVGSPPENCSAVAGTGLLLRRFSSMPVICSAVGSYTYPAADALAKQTGHFRLQRFVTSMIARAVWDLCSGQMPQSYGQPCLFLGAWVFHAVAVIAEFFCAHVLVVV